jgi:hypothetical protein
MPFLAKRSFPIVPLPVDSGSSDFKLTRGMVEAGVLVSVLYSANVTAAGTAVRARSIPIKRILLKDDVGNTLQMWRAADLVSVAQVFEQAAVGGMLVPASAFAIANYTALEAHIPLMFEQYGANIKNRDMTALPTFAFKDPGLTLTIEWGSVFDLFVTGGALAGLITFTANGAVVTQLDYADAQIKNGAALARIMPQSINRYLEVVQAAVATDPLSIDIGNTANIRGIILTQELTSTGEPTNTIINNVSFVEDNTLSVFARVPWASIRADNAKHFGVTMPTGVAVIDFAESGDMKDIYRATQKNKVRLDFSTAAVAGTIRAALLTVGPPKAV